MTVPHKIDHDQFFFIFTFYYSKGIFVKGMLASRIWISSKRTKLRINETRIVETGSMCVIILDILMYRVVLNKFLFRLRFVLKNFLISFALPLEGLKERSFINLVTHRRCRSFTDRCYFSGTLTPTLIP